MCEERSSLGHTPKIPWEFDESVTRVFDDMLARSVPQYEVMRRSCFDIACRYVREGTDIVDLGCSRGEAMAPLVDKYGTRNRFIGVETSKPTLDAVRERYKDHINSGIVEILDLDLREGFPPARASVTLSILTLQFIPVEHRPRIVGDIYESTIAGGCLVLVEKILGDSDSLDELMVELYYDIRRENGYTDEEIKRKALSLKGVLVPITAKSDEELLRSAGFRDVDCFWRWMNFAGWVAVK